jgi:hypothetical protein
MFRENIEEDADFRREMAAMRIDRVNGELHGAELGEDRNETTRGEIIAHQKPWGLKQALAEQHRGSQHVAAVGLADSGTARSLPSGARKRRSRPKGESE